MGRLSRHRGYSLSTRIWVILIVFVVAGFMHLAGKHLSSCADDHKHPTKVTVAAASAGEGALAALLVPVAAISDKPVKIGICTQRGDKLIFEKFARAAFPNGEFFESEDGYHGYANNTPNIAGSAFPVSIIFCQPKWHYPEELQWAFGNATQLKIPDVKDRQGVAWSGKEESPRLHKNRPFLIKWSSEAGRFDSRGVAAPGGNRMLRADVAFSAQLPQGSAFSPEIHWPPISYYFFLNQKNSLADLMAPRDFIGEDFLDTKPMFCAFLVKACWHQAYRGRSGKNFVMVRTAMFDLLSERKQVTPLGSCRRNETKYGTNRVRGGLLAGPSTAFRSFKFVITFENNHIDGYATEKMLNALLADSVPIYFGAPDICSYINCKRIVHCDATRENGLQDILSLPDPKSNDPDKYEPIIEQAKEHLRRSEPFQRCIEEVMRLDNNNKAYLAKLREPILPNNQLTGSIFDMGVYAQKLKAVLQASQSDILL